MVEVLPILLGGRQQIVQCRRPGAQQTLDSAEPCHDLVEFTGPGVGLGGQSCDVGSQIGEVDLDALGSLGQSGGTRVLVPHRGELGSCLAHQGQGTRLQLCLTLRSVEELVGLLQRFTQGLGHLHVP